MNFERGFKEDTGTSEAISEQLLRILRKHMGIIYEEMFKNCASQICGGHNWRMKIGYSADYDMLGNLHRDGASRSRLSKY